MFIDSVIQWPTCAARPGPKSDQKLPWSVISFEEAENTFPPTPKAQISSATLEPSSSGAAQLSRNLMPSMPRRMIATWTSQKTAKAIALCPLTSVQLEVSAVISVSSASAPIQVWIPNHPQATSARAIAATFAPRIPKLDRTSTGNGIPYFVPGCELSRIGISTMKWRSETVSRPCHHVMPAAISPDASVYVVITIESPIHNAARLYVPHVRRSTPVGARCLLDRCESGIALMLPPPCRSPHEPPASALIRSAIYAL